VPAPATIAATRVANPWWLPPFLLGRVPPGVEPRVLKVLGFVSFALFFEHYDTSLLGNALKFIVADLQIAEADLGFFQMLIRLGALPAFFLIPFIDRLGRRRLFLAALIGMSVGTLLTAFSQSAAQFVACQMFTRMFVITASAVAIVIVAEELPAATRGWGIGILAAVSASGHGLGAALFAAVDLLPWGWRALYAFGVLPLALLPMFRRNIRETARFTEHRDAQLARAARGEVAGDGWWGPLVGFFRTHPARAAGMAVVASVSSVGHVVVISFTGYYVLQYQGWAPYQLSLMVIAAGMVGIVGNVVAGRVADRSGRRVVGFAFLAVFPPVAWAFYIGPGWALPVLWSIMIFTLMGANVIIRALSSELFPTSHRGTSTGLLALTETLGAAAGLLLLGMLQARGGDLVSLIPLISLATLVAGVVLLAFPETRQRELEAISTEPDAGPARLDAGRRGWTFRGRTGMK
jgi:MFS transporter, putative metabolite:H+ symporter